MSTSRYYHEVSLRELHTGLIYVMAHKPCSVCDCLLQGQLMWLHIVYAWALPEQCTLSVCSLLQSLHVMVVQIAYIILMHIAKRASIGFIFATLCQHSSLHCHCRLNWSAHWTFTNYRIAPNFRGIKFSRIGLLQIFTEINFADEGFPLATPIF